MNPRRLRESIGPKWPEIILMVINYYFFQNYCHLEKVTRKLGIPRTPIIDNSIPFTSSSSLISVNSRKSNKKLVQSNIQNSIVRQNVLSTN